MDKKLLRMQEVRRRVPLSRSQIYLLINRGDFPQPINIGARARAFLESDIEKWIASRIDKSRARGAA